VGYSKTAAKERKYSIQVAHWELVEALKEQAAAYRRRHPGGTEQPLDGGGNAGSAYEVERVLAVVASLDPRDYDRLQELGRPIVGRLRALPKDYSPRNPGGIEPPIRTFDGPILRSVGGRADVAKIVGRPLGGGAELPPEPGDVVPERERKPGKHDARRHNKAADR
jgi:hypothetical protein